MSIAMVHTHRQYRRPLNAACSSIDICLSALRILRGLLHPLILGKIIKLVFYVSLGGSSPDVL